MKLEMYRREDGKWAWRVRATNGQIVATDGGQGYENMAVAQEMALKIINIDTVTEFEVIR
jgi:uncharacterized protein YegP (UPF0339 family)